MLLFGENLRLFLHSLIGRNLPPYFVNILQKYQLFGSYIYAKNMLVAKWYDFMSPSTSAEMMEIDLPAFNMKIFSISLVNLYMIHIFFL